MKEKTRYNTEYLVRISAYDERPDNWYKVVKEIKLFGILLRSAGVKECLGDILDIGDIPDHFIKDEIVYKKPRCVFYYTNDHVKTYYFNTYKEALDFQHQYSKYVNWID